MQTTHCNVLCEGLIGETCRYQFNAIDQKEMQALVEAHLRQDHGNEYETLSEQDLAKLENRIVNQFAI